MSEEFDAAFKEFQKSTFKKNVDRFWELFETIDLPVIDRKEWCATPQYGLNLRTIFEAIEDEDWKEIEDEIERLNSYA